jgi:hypothetical protein
MGLADFEHDDRRRFALRARRKLAVDASLLTARLLAD